MINSVLTAIKRFSLIEKGDTVTVALSGGADSVALLHALWSLKDELSINLKAAHLNHGIRGNEADRDEAFVKFLCDKFDVPVVTEKVDIPALAKERGQSIELCAREVRYEFLSRNAEGLIATAHTASDNIETLIFNLTRGAGLKGLCGIPKKRDRFIRPLILCSREMIEIYCADNSLSFVTDSTNLCDDYTRNKIRHKVVSELRYINPSIEDTVSRTTEILTEDQEALDLWADEILFKSLADDGLLTENIYSLPVSIAKRVIKKYINSVYEGLELDYNHINALYEISKNGGKINLPNNLFGEVKNGILKINAGNSVLPEYNVELVYSQNVNNLLSINLIDCDKIVGSPIIRTRLEGDKIRLKNRGCTKTLNKLFTENKINPLLRDSIPIVADDKGVFWVYGFGVADRCAATNKTESFLEIKVDVIE